MFFFATISPLFHLSTPIIAQFKALNLLFQCTPHLCYPQFFHPSWHQFDFFLTTPLLVPPTKSQHFDSYLTQIFTLNSQIIVLSPKYPPAIFKIPKFTPFHPFLKLACQKLHTFISSNWIKNCPFFAITSPFFHLSTPIIAQFKALNLPFHCIPHFCYPQFFSPIATPIWFFSTTPLLVPPSKSQFFDSYLNQFFILNSQITFIQSQRPFCPFPIPYIYPFSSLCKISMLKTVYLHFFKFESKALPFLPLLRHFFCYPQFFSPISRHQFDFFQPHCQTPRVYWNGGVCHTPEDKVFQISVIDVSFLVGFLAYFDSLILCADLCLSHITLPGPVRAVPGLFWTKIVRPLTGPAQAPCGAVRNLPPRTGPVEF